jgi:hypothetical protein
MGTCLDSVTETGDELYAHVFGLPDSGTKATNFVGTFLESLPASDTQATNVMGTCLDSLCRRLAFRMTTQPVKEKADMLVP